MFIGFPGGSDSKELTDNAGDLSLTPGLGKSSGGEHGNPFQHFCVENPHRQRSVVGYNPWGYQELDTTELLSTHTGITLRIKILSMYCTLPFPLFT